MEPITIKSRITIRKISADFSLAGLFFGGSKNTADTAIGEADESVPYSQSTEHRNKA